MLDELQEIKPYTRTHTHTQIITHKYTVSHILSLYQRLRLDTHTCAHTHTHTHTHTYTDPYTHAHTPEPVLFVFIFPTDLFNLFNFLNFYQKNSKHYFFTFIGYVSIIYNNSVHMFIPSGHSYCNNATYVPSQHHLAVTHSYTDGRGYYLSCQPAHRERLGVQCPAQVYKITVAFHKHNNSCLPQT